MTISSGFWQVRHCPWCMDASSRWWHLPKQCPATPAFYQLWKIPVGWQYLKDEEARLQWRKQENDHHQVSFQDPSLLWLKMNLYSLVGAVPLHVTADRQSVLLHGPGFHCMFKLDSGMSSTVVTETSLKVGSNPKFKIVQGAHSCPGAQVLSWASCIICFWALNHLLGESTACRGVGGSIIHLAAGRQLDLEVLPSLLFTAVAIIATYSKHVPNFLPSMDRTEFTADLACSWDEPVCRLLLKTTA